MAKLRTMSLREPKRIKEIMRLEKLRIHPITPEAFLSSVSRPAVRILTIHSYKNGYRARGTVERLVDMTPEHSSQVYLAIAPGRAISRDDIPYCVIAGEFSEEAMDFQERLVKAFAGDADLAKRVSTAVVVSRGCESAVRYVHDGFAYIKHGISDGMGGRLPYSRVNGLDELAEVHFTRRGQEINLGKF